MLDQDLAELNGVVTGNLNKAVKRNIKRFPEYFMFQLSEDEFKNLLFQTGTSSWGGTRMPPYAFPEQGAGRTKNSAAIPVKPSFFEIFAF